MSVETIRIVTCDVCQVSTFTGSPAEAYAAGWRRVGYVPKVDRCPACRERIGTRPRRKARAKPAAPVMPPRAKYRYGAAAYMDAARYRVAVEEMRSGGLSDAAVIERLRLLRGLEVWSHVE